MKINALLLSLSLLAPLPLWSQTVPENMEQVQLSFAPVVKAATLAVAEHGTRVSLVLKADYRPGHTGELDGKVQRLEQALAATEAEGTA